jgi:hypothetical protein
MQIIVTIIVKNDQSRHARNIYRVPKLAAEHAYYSLVSHRQEHPLRSHRLIPVCRVYVGPHEWLSLGGAV